MGQAKFNPIDILVIEDNRGDARLIKEVLNEHKIFNTLFIVNDGVEAMNFR